MIILLKCNLFSPWYPLYIWKFAHLLTQLNNNHSLTHSPQWQASLYICHMFIVHYHLLSNFIKYYLHINIELSIYKCYNLYRDDCWEMEISFWLDNIWPITSHTLGSYFTYFIHIFFSRNKHAVNMKTF